MSHPSEQLLDYAYGELAAPERAALEKHLASCPDCTRELEGIRGVRKTFAQLAPEPAPSAGLESLLAYAAQSAERAKEAPRKRRWWTFVTPVASLLALCLVVIVADRSRNAKAPEADRLEAAPIAQNKNLNTFGMNNEPGAPPAAPAQVVAVLEKERVEDAKDAEQREDKRAKKAEPIPVYAGKADSLGALARREHVAAKKPAIGDAALDGLLQAGRKGGAGFGAGEIGGVVGGVNGGGATGASAKTAPPPPPPPPELAKAEPKPSEPRAERAKVATRSFDDEAEAADVSVAKEEAQSQMPGSPPSVGVAQAGPAVAMAVPSRPAMAPAAAAPIEPVTSNYASSSPEPAKRAASGTKAKARGAPAVERERLIDALALATPAQVPVLLAKLCELDTREGRVEEARAECSRLVQQYAATAEATRARRALATLPASPKAAADTQ